MKDFVVEVMKLGVKKKNGEVCERGEVLYSKKLMMDKENVVLRIKKGILRVQDKRYLRKYRKNGPDPEVANMTRDPKPLDATISDIEMMTTAMIATAEHYVSDSAFKNDIDEEEEEESPAEDIEQVVDDEEVEEIIEEAIEELEEEEEADIEEMTAAEVSPHEGVKGAYRWGKTKDQLWDNSEKNGKQRIHDLCGVSFNSRNKLFGHVCEGETNE